MVEGLVTVIVPVYNVEKYLDRCVSSIISQTYTNMEVILVDDGSPDNCPRMCDDWAEKDSRIRVIHKENAGSGMARNTGIDHANGEYIYFLDSDDYIEPDTIEVCMQAARKEDADIVSFGNDRVTQSGTVLGRRVPATPKMVFSGEEVRTAVLPRALSHNPKTGENWKLSLSGCFSIFSMRLINRINWRFVSEREIISEDFYSVLKLFAGAQKVAIIDRVFYHYTVNLSSQSHEYREDRFEKLKYFYQQIVKLCEDLGVAEYTSLEAAAAFTGLALVCFKQIASSKDKTSEKLKKIKTIVNDPCLQAVLQNQDFSGDNVEKKVFWFAIRKKNVRMCYYLVQIRNIKERINEFGIKG